MDSYYANSVKIFVRFKKKELKIIIFYEILTRE